MAGEIDLERIIKLHKPTIEFPVPKMGAGLMGLGDFVSEVGGRLTEFVEPLKFFLVGGAWTAGDLVGHQLFSATAGDKTPPGYYGGKLLWSVPALAIGRIVSDFIGGPTFIRALTLGTVANGLMQARYLFGGFSSDFNWTTFLIHEFLLVPLSLLIIGSPAKAQEKKA